MERSENYSTRFVSQGYYSWLVELRAHCNMLLTELDSTQDLDTQKEFKKNLTLLVREMESKYQRRKDIDKPEVLDDKNDYNMSDVDLNDCREVLQSIRNLQEKLGITSMARNEYEMDEMGMTDKNA